MISFLFNKETFFVILLIFFLGFIFLSYFEYKMPGAVVTLGLHDWF